MLNLLDSIITLYSGGFANSLNWLGQAIQWVIGLVSNVGVGIILFTLLLKLITLPLDIYSKAKMRKNNLKMEKMRPQLEKLQKQYQNDQNTYNQKMMELYKKNGYSMFGACLPMIVTLVVFMVVLGAFSTYSQYTNVELYSRMADAYSAGILEYSPADYRNGKGTDNFSVEEIFDKENNVFQYVRTETYDDAEKGTLVRVIVKKTFLSEKQLKKGEIDKIDWSSALVTNTYYVKTDAVYNSGDEKIKKLIEKLSGKETDGEKPGRETVAMAVIRQIGRDSAENAYHEHRMGFLWVKNIWLPDTSYKHPVQYETEIGDENLYNEITHNLADEKGAANGYYILIVISIGTMFLSQFILSRSQKAQNDLQTANGQGAKTQKVMMVIMPLMFGIFSFFYSAAFSIYMVVSNIFSIVSTLLINFIIDRKFKKLEEKEILEKYNKRIPQANRTADGKSGGKKK